VTGFTNETGASDEHVHINLPAKRIISVHLADTTSTAGTPLVTWINADNSTGDKTVLYDNPTATPISLNWVVQYERGGAAILTIQQKAIAN
jgi:hypothetical protein